VSKLSPRPQLVAVRALGHKGVKAQNFQYPYMCVCVFVCVCVCVSICTLHLL
jgi:hypothetical protein